MLRQLPCCSRPADKGLQPLVWSRRGHDLRKEKRLRDTRNTGERDHDVGPLEVWHIESDLHTHSRPPGGETGPQAWHRRTSPYVQCVEPRGGAPVRAAFARHRTERGVRHDASSHRRVGRHPRGDAAGASGPSSSRSSRRFNGAISLATAGTPFSGKSGWRCWSMCRFGLWRM